MEAITAGYVPEELRRDGKDVGINFFDKHEEEYVPPPPPAYIAFSGGAVLGGATVSSGALVVSPELAASLPSSPTPVDESQPLTTIQIRTLTGQRLRVRINQSATLIDLATAINSQYTTTDSYVLTAGFPPKDIENSGQTIVQAGLLNAAITLKKC